MAWAIETVELTKQFPAQRGLRGLISPSRFGPPAVDRVTLAVREGELFSLLGPNGAGKTTLIKMMTTLILPTSGTVRVNGYDLRDEAAIKQSIGLVTSDERSFYWRLSGRQNLEFFAALHGLPSAEARSRVAAVLEQVGLEAVADARFLTYSTGTRQRLAIARALLSEPRILFLDEPTRGLDPTATRQLHDLIRKRLSGELRMTILLTTHHLTEAEQLSDRLGIMHQGRLRACGTVAELRGSLGLADRYQLQVRGIRPAMRAAITERVGALEVTPLEGGTSLLAFEARDEEDGLNDVIDIIRNGEGKVRTISREPVSLETIFAHLTQVLGNGSSPAGDFVGDRACVKSGPETMGDREPAGDGISTGRRSRRSPRDVWAIALAFLKRDVRTEASYRFSFLLQFFGIFFSVALFYFVARLLGPAAAPALAAYGGNYFAFVLIGIAFASYFGVGLSSFADTLRQAQTTGTLEAMLATPTSLSAIIVCSSLWNYLLTTLRVLMFLAVGAFFLDVSLGEGNYPVALLILVLTIVSFGSLGIIAASFVMVMKRGDPVTWAVSALSSLLGGVFYPVTVLPEWLQPLSRLLPITYALNAMRLALLQGAPLAALAPDIMALTIFGLLFLPLSLLSFRFAVRRAKSDGSLTHY